MKVLSLILFLCLHAHSTTVIKDIMTILCGDRGRYGKDKRAEEIAHLLLSVLLQKNTCNNISADV